MLDAAVVTEGLTKRFGDRVAVDRLDLFVPSGVVTGFVGPNGAGKTTTIRMLLGLQRPSAGSARVLGESLDGRLGYLERVGALVDGPAFYPRLSGRANLRVLAHLSPGRADVDRALATTGMVERAEDPVSAYSLGMRQRLAISAALLTEPELVVLDEPANGLDPAGVVELRQLLRGLADAGTTVLVSSHQLGELEQISDHMVLLGNGRLVYQGGLAELLETQAGRITAAPEVPGDGERLAELVTGQGWPAQVEDGSVIVSAPAGAAAELNRLAHHAGITLSELQHRPPTLEETFFALAGEADAVPTEGSR